MHCSGCPCVTSTATQSQSWVSIENPSGAISCIALHHRTSDASCVLTTTNGASVLQLYVAGRPFYWAACPLHSQAIIGILWQILQPGQSYGAACVENQLQHCLSRVRRRLWPWVPDTLNGVVLGMLPLDRLFGTALTPLQAKPNNGAWDGIMRSMRLSTVSSRPHTALRPAQHTSAILHDREPQVGGEDSD